MSSRLFKVLSAVTLVLASCSQDAPEGITGYGEMKPTFTADYRVNDSRTTSRATSAPTLIQPSLSDFYVHLKKNDGTVDKTWSKVSEMATTEKFAVGEYSLEAYYGDLNEEGFDKPYFYGSTTFNIYDGDVAKPEVVASLCNTMVSVDYTDAFVNYFAEYTTTIHSTGGAYITFEKDEQRAAYVKPGDISISMQLTNKEGKSISIEPAAITGAKSKTHYRITFDVNGGEVGTAVLKITFDDTVVDGGEVAIALGDDLFNAEAPAINAVDFTPGTALKYTEGDEPAKGPRMSMIAMAGFSEVVLTTQSAYLIGKGWPEEIDLTKANTLQKALLQQYGLKVSGLWGATTSNMAMVDFAGVIPNLRVSDGNSDHAFTIVVKDVLTRVTEPLTVNISAPSVLMSLPESTTTIVGTGVATCEMTYSGSDLAKNVKMQVQGSNGVWKESTIKSVTALGNNKYSVTFTVPVSSSVQQAKAIYKNDLKVSNTMAVNPVGPSLTLSCNAYDVWATKVIVSLASDKGDASELAKIATLYLSTDGGSTYSKTTNFTVSGTAFTVSGLTAGTEYRIKASVVNSADDASEALTFTTETAAQLANSDMESWNKKSIGSVLFGSTYYDYLPYASGESDIWWATNNARGYDYSVARVSVTSCCAVSNSTSVKHGGASSAQIYTSGHGGGYASTAQIMYPESAFAGRLFIGSYSWNRSGGETVDTGHSFTSRPSSLTFWYQYQPKGTDQFKAEVEVRSGSTVIAKGEFVPTATSEADAAFKQATVSLTYTTTNAKATDIYVSFLSTTKTSFSSSDFNKNSSITMGGDKRSAHYGSILYIDDLSLKY